MDRREALKALVSMPAVQRISVARLQPNDVIVIECEHHISESTLANIKERIQLFWPDRKVLVLDGMLKLKVVDG